ncbi:hypothetical protein JW824_05130, partial [bacterium]|nr:hypothetical protein [bacterium]
MLPQTQIIGTPIIDSADNGMVLVSKSGMVLVSAQDPAAKFNIMGVIIVSIVFSAVTISTMLGCVMISYYGLSKFSFPRIAR